MLKRIKTWLALTCGALVVAASLFAATPEPAYADLGYTDAQGNHVDCPHEGVYSGRVVKCVKVGLRVTLDIYLERLSSYMRPIVIMTLTLAIAIYGMKVLMGDSYLNTKTFMFLIKIGCVLLFSYKFGGMTDYVFSTMEDMQNIVTNNMFSDSANCPIPSGDPSMVVWNRMDCLVGRIIGFGENVFLYNGVLGVLGAALFSPGSGFALFFVGVAAVWMILMMVFRAVYIFLLAYSTVAFMILMSPIIMPLLLFNVTTVYFTRWIDQLLSAMLEPLVLFAFLSLFLKIFETAIFDGPDSLASTLGFSHDAIWRSNQHPFSWKIPTDPDFYDKISQAGGQAVSGLSDVISKLYDHALDFNVLSTSAIDLGAQQVQRMQHIMISMLSFIVICLLAHTMMQYIPEWARRIVGSRSAVSIIDGKTMPLESRISSTFSGFGNRVRSSTRTGGFAGWG